LHALTSDQACFVQKLCNKPGILSELGQELLKRHVFVKAARPLDLGQKHLGHSAPAETPHNPVFVTESAHSLARLARSHAQGELCRKTTREISSVPASASLRPGGNGPHMIIHRLAMRRPPY
jgi:hypothetical protein